MNFTVREARPPDFTAVAEWLQPEASDLSGAGLRLPVPLAPPEFERQVQTCDGRSYVLVVGADPIAFGQYALDGESTVQLWRLIVRKGFRRMGHGSALCALVMDAAVTATGARAVTVEVDRDNMAARNLFAARGFQVVTAESDDRTLYMRCMVRQSRAPQG